ncbi:hypothetical protein [Ancylobacter radicis]|uniref:hypothetical protein n=1 Tax=Ancylobacter radicis TaxID=2836179 RepID=UPI0020230BFB|nr:hypothetical protein [Ancylobacter radicis]
MTAHTPLMARALLAATLALALAGCPGDSEPESRERVAASVSDALAKRGWLEPTDPTDPARWLASREAGSDLPADAPAVAGWQTLLREADQRFGETDRMIANRATQLEAMLAEIGMPESTRQILDEFMPFAPKGSRRGFSDLCQHYYNLRKQGLSRADALAALGAETPRAEVVAPADPRPPVAPSPMTPAEPRP